MMSRLCCAALLLSAFFALSAGQGVPRDPASVLGAISSYRTLQQYLERSAAWRQAYRFKSAAACSNNSGSLCASRSVAEKSALVLGTAPQIYDQRDSSNTGGIMAVSSALDQGECFTCTSFAIGAAAETAVALALEQNASNWFGIQDFHFCATVPPGSERTCSNPWSLNEGFNALAQLQYTGKLTTGSCLPYQPTSGNPCAYKCRDRYPDPSVGYFQYVPLPGLVQVQEWLQLHGSVVTGIQIYPDFQSFFSKSPGGIYKGPDPKYSTNDTYGHAVVIIGYNNQEEYWLVKNSWGKDFAVNGTFKIAYGASGIADLPNSLGLKLKNYGSQPIFQASELTVITGKPNCYRYTARTSDYVGKLAWKFGMPIEEVLLDNLDNIPQTDMWLGGKVLTICNPNPPMLLNATTEMEALLQFSGWVDRNFVLSTWATQTSGSIGPCQWQGITCDASGKVEKIILSNSQLHGVLPDASTLQPLTRLKELQLNGNFLQGPLPASWGSLAQLTGVLLEGNQLTGTLPHQWSGLHNLTALSLGYADSKRCYGNRLTGTLPQEWALMHQIKLLNLSCNMFTGTLPPEWANLTRLQTLVLAGNKLHGPLPDDWSRLAQLNGLTVGGSVNGQCIGNMLSGTLPASWVKMQQVDFMLLGCNQFTGTLPPQWSALPELRVLSLSGNKLTGTLPKVWGTMKHLTVLNLGGYLQGVCVGNMLTGTLPPEWAALTGIQTMSLACNNILGSLPSSWGSLTTLKGLSVGNNKLLGSLPPQWASMKSLATLYLSNNDFVGEVPASWAQGMQMLQRIDLQGNHRLSGCLPSAWSSTVSSSSLQVVSGIVTFIDTNITGFC